MIKILLCDQNKKWLENFKVKLTDSMELIAAIETGKEAQDYLINNPVDVLIINCATKNFSIFEVVKFIKQKTPKTLILMISESEEELNEYFYSEKEISKLGIVKHYIKPFPVYHMVKYIEDSFKHHLWVDLKQVSGETLPEEEVSESDQRFSSLPYNEFGNNNIAIFDLYIRLKKNKYLKVFHKQERIEFPRIQRYLEKDSELKLYFKTSDRISYINFTNENLKKLIKKQKENKKELFKKVDTTTRLLVEEIYTHGLPDHVVEESLSSCENIFSLVNQNQELKKIMKELFSSEITEEAHVSLTAFYTAITCLNIDWVTEHSRNNILLGAILHDIGKVKLSKKMKTTPIDELKPQELMEFQKHPEYGVEILDQLIGISEQVKQIVYQHHELNSGDGYPNSLLARKIYPLAKIVSFTNFLANYSLKRQMGPLEALKYTMEEKDDIMKYEPFVIKAFIKGFIKDV